MLLQPLQQWLEGWYQASQWNQFLVTIVATILFYIVGIWISKKYHPTRFMFKNWIANLFILAVPSVLILQGAVYFIPVSFGWKQLLWQLSPALAFGISYGLIFRDIPKRNAPGAKPKRQASPGVKSSTREDRRDAAIRARTSGRPSGKKHNKARR